MTYRKYDEKTGKCSEGYMWQCPCCEHTWEFVNWNFDKSEIPELNYEIDQISYPFWSFFHYSFFLESLFVNEVV
jgi:hypothetical protein